MSDLEPLLKRLHLANARRTWKSLVERAEKEEWTYEALLQTLFAEEVAHRRGTRLARAVRSAGFPFLRTVEEFDFSYQSTLRLTSIGSLLAPDFVTEGGAVILEGKPGRGKTHLAVAIAYRALQNGFDALFATCADLIDDLSAASRQGKLRDAVARYVRPHLLVVDEVGYLSYGDDAANVLFHVVNERHIKRRAMVFTTNKSPKHWGQVLHDDDLADAIVDRILHRGRLLRLDGPSVRTKHLPEEQVADCATPQDSSRRISGIEAAEFPEPTSAVAARVHPSTVLRPRRGRRLARSRRGPLCELGRQRSAYGCGGSARLAGRLLVQRRCEPRRYVRPASLHPGERLPTHRRLEVEARVHEREAGALAFACELPGDARVERRHREAMARTARVCGSREKRLSRVACSFPRESG